MTEDREISLREKLLAHRARLLDFAAQQAEADPHSWGWLHMVADIQLALMALDETTGDPLWQAMIDEGVARIRNATPAY